MPDRARFEVKEVYGGGGSTLPYAAAFRVAPRGSDGVYRGDLAIGLIVAMPERWPDRAGLDKETGLLVMTDRYRTWPTAQELEQKHAELTDQVRDLLDSAREVLALLKAVEQADQVLHGRQQ